jgi:hypothetical protein
MPDGLIRGNHPAKVSVGTKIGQQVIRAPQMAQNRGTSRIIAALVGSAAQSWCAKPAV